MIQITSDKINTISYILQMLRLNFLIHLLLRIAYCSAIIRQAILISMASRHSRYWLRIIEYFMNSFMKYINEASAKTAMSYGCKQVDELADEINERTKVFAISREEWTKEHQRERGRRWLKGAKSIKIRKKLQNFCLYCKSYLSLHR